LSQGRIIAGFVRGIGSEYRSSGTNPYFSHKRFREAHDLIIRVWTEPGPFAFDGDHFSLRYVNLWPGLTRARIRRCESRCRVRARQSRGEPIPSANILFW
jgi:alkanesulfonate monooxygenase SsuD/methylene tetrahydromethanopterin reductase-like flavin-dependent oxidoreductase (luciferase family)